MLARRFTIVCLLTALFGMAFASIAARSDTPRVAPADRHFRCTFIHSFDC